jgi:hypothetical protein
MAEYQLKGTARQNNIKYILITFSLISSLFINISLTDGNYHTYVEQEEKKVVKDILSRDEVRAIVSQYPLWNTETMVNISFCESSFRPQVVNDNPNTKDYSVGLFQINLYGNLAKERPSKEELKDPEKNIEFAYKLWQSQGYNAWRNCLK